MTDNTTNDQAVEEEVHELVGLPDGYVDANGEKIVYEYNEDGNFAGWHKEGSE